MSQVGLDFNLASYLLFDLRLDNFGFVEAFESDDVVRLFLGSSHVYATEFPFPEWPSDLERVKTPVTEGPFTATSLRKRN